MKFDGPLEPGSTFRLKAIVSTLEQVDAPRYVRWRGKTMGVKAIHEWRLEPRDSGTHVETEESFSGLLASLLRGSLQKTLDTSLEQGLGYLKSEAGRQAAA